MKIKYSILLLPIIFGVLLILPSTVFAETHAEIVDPIAVCSGQSDDFLVTFQSVTKTCGEWRTQDDIPQIVPTEDNINKMMPKQVSGTYTNDDYGISVDLPSGWNGIVSELKVSDAPIIQLQVMERGIESNMDAMKEGKFAIIMFTIADKTDDKTIPEPEPPTDEYEVDCSYIFAEKITLDGKNAMKLEAECTGTDISMKIRSFHYATADKIVVYAYTTSPSSIFDNHVDQFEDSVKTLSIDNLVDIAYEIPDEMMKDSKEIIDEEFGDKEIMQEIIISPRKQIEVGTAPTEVVCNDGKELLIKVSTGSGACVKSSSVSKLVERGWGTLP